MTKVTDDKKVIKKILKKWKGYEHPNGVVVKLKLMGKLQDETLTDEECTWTKMRVVFRKGNTEKDNVFFFLESDSAACG